MSMAQHGLLETLIYLDMPTSTQLCHVEELPDDQRLLVQSLARHFGGRFISCSI
jgi:hypothetical protein